MTKILLVSPISWDSTSFYRSSGVFHNLAKKIDVELHAFQGNRFTWAQLGAYDIIFLQRPASPENLALAQYCKTLGCKIWMDYDDNLFAVPFESRAYFDYDDQVRKTMLRIMLLADQISVSTAELKTFFEAMKVETPIEIIPNAVNTDWIKPVESFNADSKVIVWRGSETHWFDVECFTPQIYEAMKESEDVWHFMGWCPATLMYTDMRAKIVTHKGEDVMVYNRNLMALKPRIMHVPLVENALNKAKSNIAFIEATCAGAVTIAPNWPEWQHPGVICYSNLEEYEQLLKIPSLDYAKCWRDSMDFINQNLRIDYVNQKRIDIINKLCPKKREIFTISSNDIKSAMDRNLSTLTETQTE